MKKLFGVGPHNNNHVDNNNNRTTSTSTTSNSSTPREQLLGIPISLKKKGSSQHNSPSSSSASSSLNNYSNTTTTTNSATTTSGSSATSILSNNSLVSSPPTTSHHHHSAMYNNHNHNHQPITSSSNNSNTSTPARNRSNSSSTQQQQYLSANNSNHGGGGNGATSPSTNTPSCMSPNTLQGHIQNMQQAAKNEQLHAKQIQLAKLYKFQFEEIYDNPETRNLFKQFLIKNQNGENIYFDKILDAEYKPLKSNRNRYYMAKRIIETFIKEGSPYEVNLSEKIKQNLLKEFAKSSEENCPIDLFDSVQYQVLSSMRMDAYPRFVQSDEFLSFIGSKIQSSKNMHQKLRFLKAINAIRKVSPLDLSSSKANLRKSLNMKHKKTEEDQLKEALIMDQIELEDNAHESLILPISEDSSLTTPRSYYYTYNSTNNQNVTSPPLSSPNHHYFNSPNPSSSELSPSISEPSSIKRSMSNLMGHFFKSNPDRHHPNNEPSSSSTRNSTTSTAASHAGAFGSASRKSDAASSRKSVAASAAAATVSSSGVQPYVHTTRNRHSRSGSALGLSLGDLSTLSNNSSSSGSSNSIGVKLHDSLPRAIAPINNFIVTPCSDDEDDDDDLTTDGTLYDNHNRGGAGAGAADNSDDDDIPLSEQERIKRFDTILSRSSMFGKSAMMQRHHETGAGAGGEVDAHHQKMHDPWQDVESYISGDSSSDDDDDDGDDSDDMNHVDIGGNLAAIVGSTQVNHSNHSISHNTVIPIIEKLSSHVEDLQLSTREIDSIKSEYMHYVDNKSVLDLATILKQVDEKDKSSHTTTKSGWSMVNLQSKKRLRRRASKSSSQLDLISRHSVKAYSARHDSLQSDDITYMLRRSCRLPYSAFSVLQILADESSDETIVNPLLTSPAEYIEFIVKETEHAYASLISLEGARWPWPLKQRHYVTTGTVISDPINDEKDNPGRKRYIIVKRSVVNNPKLEITLNNKKDNPNRVFGLLLEAYFIESFNTNECTLTMFNEWKFTNANKWSFPTKLFRKTLKKFSIDFHQNLIERLSSSTGTQPISYHEFISSSGGGMINNQQDTIISPKNDRTLLHTLFRNEALSPYKKKEEIKGKVHNIFNTLSLMRLFEYDLVETCRVIEERYHNHQNVASSSIVVDNTVATHVE